MADKNGEKLAKFILEEVLGDRFKDLKHEDKPDLQNKDLGVGVEVTQAMCKHSGKWDGMVRSLMDGSARDLEGTKKQLEEMGSSVDLITSDGKKYVIDISEYISHISNEICKSLRWATYSLGELIVQLRCQYVCIWLCRFNGTFVLEDAWKLQDIEKILMDRLNKLYEIIEGIVKQICEKAEKNVSGKSLKKLEKVEFDDFTLTFCISSKRVSEIPVEGVYIKKESADEIKEQAKKDIDKMAKELFNKEFYDKVSKAICDMQSKKNAKEVDECLCRIVECINNIQDKFSELKDRTTFDNKGAKLGMVCGSDGVHPNIIYDRVDDKLKKLNGLNKSKKPYKEFKNQYLFIYNSSVPIYDKEENDIWIKLKEKQSNFEKKFSSIFVYGVPLRKETLFEFRESEWLSYHVPEDKITTQLQEQKKN